MEPGSLPRLVGQAARAWPCADRRTPIAAEKAAEWGLIWKAVDDQEALDLEVEAIASKLGSSAAPGASRDQGHDPFELAI